MRILGIDPGSNVTGYGFIDFTKQGIKLLEVGEITPKKKDPIHIRINTIYSTLEQLIKQYKPDTLILEKLYAHYKHPATASIIGHARGIIYLLCAQKNIELVEESVKRVRKSVTGNGNASKAQTRRLISHTFNIDERKLTLDASDALALAYSYTRMNAPKS